MKGSETCTLHDPQRGALLNCIFLRKPEGFLRKGRPRLMSGWVFKTDGPRCFCGRNTLEEGTAWVTIPQTRPRPRQLPLHKGAFGGNRGCGGGICPPSVASGDSFPQIAQTSAEVWKSADADAIQRGNQFPLWDPLRSLRGRELGTPFARPGGRHWRCGRKRRAGRSGKARSKLFGWFFILKSTVL